MSERVEAWQQADDDGHVRAAIVDVRADGTVLATYEHIAHMLHQLGFTKTEVQS